MGINKEMCLKNIIKAKFDEYDEKFSLIFTTYDFEIEFFENQLLPFLLDVDNYKGRTNNRGKYIAHDLDPKLENIDLKVFYDHFERDRVSNINYKAYENPLKKMLHAKLVIIIGEKNSKKNMTVFVASANLTASSYGTNMENIAIIENTDKEIINKIEKTDSLKDILKSLNEIEEIAITGINEESNKIKKQLDKCTKLDVISPFIENSIIDEYKSKTEKMDIVFTNLRGLKNKEKFINNSKYIKVYPKNERGIHSKIYVLENMNTVIIGSHNFTKKAINDGNIEASLIVNDKSIFNDCKKFFYSIKDKCEDFNILNDDIEEIVENDNKEKINSLYIRNAEIDWYNEKMTFEIKSKEDNSIDIRSIDITIGDESSNDYKVVENNKELWIVEFEITEEIKYQILDSKYFDMIINGNLLVSGILFEKDHVMDKLTTSKGTCFNDILNYRFHDKDEYDDEDLEENKMEKSHIENEEDIIESDNYNITDMFLYVRNRERELDNFNQQNYVIKADTIKGLAHLLNQFYNRDKEDDNDFENNKRKVLYYLLTYKEIIRLWKKLDRNKKEEKKDAREKRKKIEDNYNELKSFAINLLYKDVENIKELSKDKNQVKKLLELYLKNFGE